MKETSDDAVYFHGTIMMKMHSVDSALLDRAVAGYQYFFNNPTSNRRRNFVNREIFRQYDIRGMVDRDLTEEVAWEIGRGYGTLVIRKGYRNVTCGMDGRVHSYRLQSALVEGINASGCDVLNIGECPTPLLYFSIFHFNADGGIMVTGSHNPPEYNGFKMCIGTGTIYGETIQQIRKIIENKDFESGRGEHRHLDIEEPYLAHLKDNIKLERPIEVVLDAGNGVAGRVAPDAFTQAGCKVHALYCDVDGTFPNHHPDPTIPANLDDLIKKVRETGADVGMAYDGDGDRLGAVDEKGNIIYGDKLLLLFARKVLEKNPGAAIIGEVKCSKVLYDDIAAHGGRPIMWKTGHSLIKQKMKEEHALLAGEMSGHLFFADRYFGFDDGIYASLRLAEIIAQGSRPLSSYFEDVPVTYSTPEIRNECPEKYKFEIVEKVKKWFQEHDYRIIDVDGVRVEFDDGWGLIRASNTQPVLVLRFEATTAERLKEIQELVESRLEAVKKEMTD